ncbi:hypothetical protein DFH28DRAFT_882223, partial [Melampsora americana]
IMSQADVYHARNCYLVELISKQRTSKGKLTGAGWTKVTAQFNAQYPGSFSKALLKAHFDHLEKTKSADSGDLGDPILMSRAEMLQGDNNGHPGGEQAGPGSDLSRSSSTPSLVSTPTPKQNKRNQSDSGSGSLSRKRSKSKKTEDDPPYSVPYSVKAPSLEPG